MAYEHAQFEPALAAALGDDQALLAELRASFHSSIDRQIDLLSRARCDANWNFAALRLRGVAASFGVTAMMELADEALDGAPGDPVIIRKLRTSLNSMRRKS